jgi:hypothetical protein
LHYQSFRDWRGTEWARTANFLETLKKRPAKFLPGYAACNLVSRYVTPRQSDAEILTLHPHQYAEVRGGSLAPRPLDDDSLLSTSQVLADLGGLSRMGLWRWIRDPRVAYPPPDVVINGRNYWKVGTHKQWKAARIAASTPAAAPQRAER